MNKKILLWLILLFLPVYAANGGEKEGKKEENKIDVLKREIFSIWPEGNCADNISGNNRYVLISIACTGSYSEKDRKRFFDTVLSRGWAVQKETYRINPSSAGYFYKFTNGRDKYLYFKLFFRNMEVVWPVHVNKRPKIAILVNNVSDLPDLEPWENINLPIAIGLDISSEKTSQLLSKAEELHMQPLVYLPDSVKGRQSNDAVSLKAYLDNLKNYPDEKFPFWGLCVQKNSFVSNETRLVRVLYGSIRKYGITNVISGNTQEITDTAKIMDVRAMVNTFYMSNDVENDQTVWHNAFGNARSTGYSIIILNASDKDARNLLLGNISENISFIDIVPLKDIPVKVKPVEE